MILKTDGTPFDHLEEYTGARNALVNTLEAIKRRIDQLVKLGDEASLADARLLRDKFNDISALLDTYESAAGGLP